MKALPSLTKLAEGFWSHLERRRRRQLFVLLVLMVLTSFAEVLSLGAVLPFLGVLTQPDRVFAYPDIQPILSWLHIANPRALLLPITLAFIAAALLAGGMRLLLLYVQTRLSFAVGADFSDQIYRRTLYQPYAVHVSRNSSEVISGVTTKAVMVINYFLMPILTLLSSAVILLAILLALLSVDPLMSLAAFAGFGAIYGVVMLVTRTRLAAYSRQIADESDQVVKVLQEGLGGIRDVLLDGTQEAYCEQYRQADIPLRRAQANSVIVGGAPRFIAEAAGMAFIAILAYAMAQQDGGVTNTIVVLGALALGAQRLLPVLQQGYLSVVQLRSSRDSLRDALDLLNQPIDAAVYVGARELAFERSIELRNLGFRYAPTGPQILHDVNLQILRGSRVGFVGTTGNGKSTLVDILMGLLTPTEGEIRIDDTLLTAATQRAWQRRIAHVPQAIYLTDASIAENIAFGVPAARIDHDRVRHAAAQAQIDHHIESLPDRYDTLVGERGVRLSGGQRQRIGIARALYKRAEILVLDEATSALDVATEHSVMDAIDNLSADLTVLLIAHRLSTLRGCDQIVELQDGRIADIQPGNRVAYS
ncbi:MAG: ABC transporter ATP-binding protein [Castellaniella sp.]|uniref:ABC transporter ATP-binding protein n=1 Tax=Castellaniella sp. TaxID=1955812 RepID=UPI001229CD90|nr:ABC transporter ATP-binding protein [Castellaniella sp.]TAN28407.1 MAG: ABC transporter ATP-binding protein [Castellaniella sp.]